MVDASLEHAELDEQLLDVDLLELDVLLERGELVGHGQLEVVLDGVLLVDELLAARTKVQHQVVHQLHDHLELTRARAYVHVVVDEREAVERVVGYRRRCLLLARFDHHHRQQTK